MSAVASSEAVPASAALAVPGVVSAAPAVHDVEAAEQKRWMTWFGLPALIAAFFVGAVFATGQEWYLGLAIAAIVADIGVLVWLAMSSDTNSLIGDHPAPSH
jgi:hypothetical protein